MISFWIKSDDDKKPRKQWDDNDPVDNSFSREVDDDEDAPLKLKKKRRSLILKRQLMMS